MWVSGTERRKEVDSKAYSIVPEFRCCFETHNVAIGATRIRPMVLSKNPQHFRHLNCVAYL
jgi:hypothetical protein